MDNYRSGFVLSSSSNNIFILNLASNNGEEGFQIVSSNNNLLTSNSAINNANYGILAELSVDNFIYLNNFISNIQFGVSQAFDIDGSNAWTNGTHGNYWSDYLGFDMNQDGIGDTPYIISGTEGVIDPHPLSVINTEVPIIPDFVPTISHSSAISLEQIFIALGIVIALSILIVIVIFQNKNKQTSRNLDKRKQKQSNTANEEKKLLSTPHNDVLLKMDELMDDLAE